jgi:hypothetical protein
MCYLTSLSVSHTMTGFLSIRHGSSLLEWRNSDRIRRSIDDHALILRHPVPDVPLGTARTNIVVRDDLEQGLHSSHSHRLVLFLSPDWKATQPQGNHSTDTS